MSAEHGGVDRQRADEIFQHALDLTGAERHQRGALDIWTVSLGADHVQISWCYNNLGLIRREQGASRATIKRRSSCFSRVSNLSIAPSGQNMPRMLYHSEIWPTNMQRRNNRSGAGVLQPSFGHSRARLRRNALAPEPTTYGLGKRGARNRRSCRRRGLVLTSHGSRAR